MEYNKEKKEPLVSIVVITYNSVKYVEETLDSIYNQTYNNIELIISDDCSKDNTIDFCKEWLDKFKDRFVRTKLITVSTNSGIPSNCNRGVNEAKGEWIKYIAADDALFPTAIEKVIFCANKYPEINFLLAQIEIFKDNFNKENSMGINLQNWEKNNIYLDKAQPQSQIEFLLNGSYFSAPGYFIKNSLLKKVGGFNIKYNLIEDLPLVLRVLLANEKIFFRPIVTTKYRKHAENVTADFKTTLPGYYKQYVHSLLSASLKYGKLNYIVDYIWNMLLTQLIFGIGNSGKLCFSINKYRLKFRPLRFFRLIGVK